MKRVVLFIGFVLAWGQSLQCYTASNSDLPDDIILSIYVDDADTAWIGTGNGLIWYANSTFRTSALAPANWIAECVKTPNGALWCAYYNLAASGGVFRYHNGTITWYRKNDIAPAYWRPEVLGRSIAREGNTVWVGLFGAGLAKYDGTSWTWYHPRITTGMPDSIINAIAVDAQGHKWLGTEYQGVVRFDGSTWTQLGPTGSGPISDILITSSGEVYVAAQNGLYKYGGTPFSWQSLSSSRSNALAFDGSTLWIAQSGGVAQYDGNTVTIFLSSANGLPPGAIRSIGRRGSGPLYVGTLDTGMCVYRWGGTGSLLGSLKNGKAMKVYPLPAGEYLYLQLAAEEEIAQVRLLSPDGGIKVFNLSYRQQGKGLWEIEMPRHLPAGCYILEVVDRKGWYGHARIVTGIP